MALLKVIFCILFFLLALRIINASAQTPNSYSLKEMNEYEIHQVVKGETLYSLSKQYKTTIKIITDLNPQLTNNKLKTGTTIKLPKLVTINNIKPNEKYTDTYTGIGPKPYLVAIYYTVQKGETLYGISKKTNNDVEAVKLWNDLKTEMIKPGDDLIVGYGDGTITRIVDTTTVKDIVITDVPKTEVPKENNKIMNKNPDTKIVSTTKKDTVVKNKTAPNTNVITKNTETNKQSSGSVFNNYGKKEEKLVYIVEKGLCTWTHGNSDNGNYFALHPSAPIGSTISVKNMMNNRSVQVKVIGRLPNTPENDNIEIKISGSAAKQIGAVDEKFLVQVNYMGYEKKNEVEAMK